MTSAQRQYKASASGAAEEDAHAPSSERDGLAGGDSRGTRRVTLGVWMASRVASTEGLRRARGQAAGGGTMRQNGLRARGKRCFRVSTKGSNHALPIAPNLLARKFTVAAANTVRAGNMTYIPTGEGWLYLAVVLDLFSRRIVGWAMGASIDAALACRALEMAWQQRLPGKGLIFHSDRGSQYASHRYTELLAKHGMKALVSGKGNCWDNACSETLFGSLKVERLHGIPQPQGGGGRNSQLAALVQRIKNALHPPLSQSRSLREEAIDQQMARAA